MNIVMRSALAALLLAPIVTLAAGNGRAAPTIGDLGRRTIEVRKDAAVSGSAAKAMESYRGFLELQNTDPKLRAEALRRLGDLNLESGELERLSSEVTQLDMQGAEAIRLYSTLLQAYPDYPRNDQVLYQLARAYETTGQGGQALATLDSIVKRYPGSREIGEVQFRRGELLFSARRYPDSQAAYQAVIDRGAQGSAFFEQSLYKLGWAQFKQTQNEDSLATFMKLLDLKLVDRQRGNAARDFNALSRPERELAEDTLRVMGITFSYMDGAASVDELLDGRGAVPYAWLLYSRLGDLYVEKQRYQDAASTYRAFVARDPVDEHAPSLSNQAIQAYEKGGFSELVVVGKTEYVTSYGFGKPFWSGRERDRFPQVVGELKSNLKDLAQHHHSVAQKSKKLEDYGTAARWYGEYLGSFPDDPDSAETNYMLAEVLFESRQFANAAREYERSAYAYPLGARSATAGYAALVAYQKQEELLGAEQRPAWHAQYTESGLRFADTFPQHPEATGVQTRAAQDLFAARDLPRAMAVAEKLLARQPPVDRAKQRIGWTIIGQSQFDLGAYDKSEAALVRALGVVDANAPERADITERLATAVYRQAEAKRKAGDEAGAADDFLRVAVVAPASKVVATSQYDAAAALINTKQWVRAISVLEDYRRVYPKGEYATDVSRKLAVAYVEAGMSAQAATEFERIAAVPGEEPAVVREALARAADLHQAAGNTARSVAMLEQLVQKFPTPAADAIETRARLADIAAKAGNAERRNFWQNEIIKADANAGAGRTERTRYLAATARLAQVAPSRDAFRAVRLTAPLKQSLASKRKAMEVALKGYQSVATYNVAATTTAATFEMAELYRTLARDLMASERPNRLSGEEREQYDALLEEQAFPLEEEAIGIHELNAKRAPDGVYDDAVKQSFKALAELKPARYGKTESSLELVTAPGAGADSAASTDFARAVGRVQAGQLTDAELEFKQLELQYPAMTAASVNLALLAKRAGRREEADAALRRVIEREPANAVALTELGVLQREAGKFADARASHERAVAADPANAAAWRNLGVLLDLYVGDSAAALPALEKYRELTGEDKPVSGWIADIRQRTGIKAPVAPVPAAPAEAAPGDATPAAPATPAAGGTT